MSNTELLPILQASHRIVVFDSCGKAGFTECSTWEEADELLKIFAKENRFGVLQERDAQGNWPDGLSASF
jgi:hypothetical protein